MGALEEEGAIVFGKGMVSKGMAGNWVVLILHRKRFEDLQSERAVKDMTAGEVDAEDRNFEPRNTRNTRKRDQKQRGGFEGAGRKEDVFFCKGMVSKGMAEIGKH